MKLGIALPNHLPYHLDRRLLLSWARSADEAGFEMLATLDRPNYDGWDPLVTLAGVATVTERIKLATAILQLPNRNEVVVAKQAAVVDRLCNGRLELGLGIGSRPDDYEVFGASFEDRGRRFLRQVGIIREIWDRAAHAEELHGALGPSPLPGRSPFVWIGATTERTMRRAVAIGDGLMLSGTNSLLNELANRIKDIRAIAGASGKTEFPISRILYVAIGSGPSIHELAIHNLARFYDRWAWAPLESMIHIGPANEIAEVAARHAEAGLDLLILIPEILDLKQVEILAEEVLPTYR